MKKFFEAMVHLINMGNPIHIVLNDPPKMVHRSTIKLKLWHVILELTVPI